MPLESLTTDSIPWTTNLQPMLSLIERELGLLVQLLGLHPEAGLFSASTESTACKHCRGWRLPLRHWHEQVYKVLVNGGSWANISVDGGCVYGIGRNQEV